MSVTISVRMDGRGPGISKKISDILKSRQERAEKIIATQVMKDTEKYVPALTGSLSARTHLEGHQIVYPGPYARYLYYGKRMVDSQTGRGPFYIPEVGFRYHRGAVLVPTNEDLKFTKQMHPLATSHWFEVSKAANLEKWIRVAGKAMENAKSK